VSTLRLRRHRSQRHQVVEHGLYLRNRTDAITTRSHGYDRDRNRDHDEHQPDRATRPALETQGHRVDRLVHADHSLPVIAFPITWTQVEIAILAGGYLLKDPEGYTCHWVRPHWRLPKRASNQLHV
jgi:hypothetical protein